jgi:hypothetical protein
MMSDGSTPGKVRPTAENKGVDMLKELLVEECYG